MFYSFGHHIAHILKQNLAFGCVITALQNMYILLFLTLL